MIEPIILSSLAGVIASLLAALYSLFRKKTDKEKIQKQRESLKNRVSEISIDLGIIKFTQSLQREASALPQEGILDQLENRIIERLKEQPEASDETIKLLIQDDLTEFRKRIEKIENRFPEESKIEKIASINDALLSERIDQLKEKIDKLESGALNRWDVAIVVSKIIGGICFVIGAVYAVLKAFGIV